MSNSVNLPVPPQITIIDGAHRFELDGATAMLIRMVVEQRNFFNAAYNAGVVHLHFSGKDGTANMKSELDWHAQANANA